MITGWGWNPINSIEACEAVAAINLDTHFIERNDGSDPLQVIEFDEECCGQKVQVIANILGCRSSFLTKHYDEIVNEVLDELEELIEDGDTGDMGPKGLPGAKGPRGE